MESKRKARYGDAADGLAQPVVALLRRWQWGTHKKWLRLTRGRYGIEKRLGCLWLLDQKSAVDRSLIVRGYWEPGQFALRRLAIEFRPVGVRSIFLDVGAHGGIYAILMHKEALFDEIVMFEPEPTNAAQLTANLFLNDLVGKLRLVQAAASNRSGRMLFAAGPDFNRGVARAVSLDKRPMGAVSEVDTVRIDDVISLESGFLVAKIDVEGAENAVLEGMEKLLAANRCVLQIESFKENEDALRAWLEPRGFRQVSRVDVDYFFTKTDLIGDPPPRQEHGLA